MANFLKTTPLDIFQNIVDDFSALMARPFDGDDPEYVHQLRICIRRLRAMFIVFKKYLPADGIKLWHGVLRDFLRGMGQARDMDVFILFLEDVVRKDPDAVPEGGIRFFIEYLSAVKRRAYAGVKRDIRRLRASQLEASLRLALSRCRKRWRASFPSRKAPVSRLCVDSLKANLHEVSECARRHCSRDDHEGLHRLRIAIKHVRYTLEMIVSLYPDEAVDALSISKRLQGILGDMHDAHVWMGSLSVIRQKARALVWGGPVLPVLFSEVEDVGAYLRKKFKRKHLRAYKKFVKLWRDYNRKQPVRKVIERLKKM